MALHHASKLHSMMTAKSVTAESWSIFMVFSGEWEISGEEAEAPTIAPFLLTQARDLKSCKTCLGCVLPKKRERFLTAESTC